MKLHFPIPKLLFFLTLFFLPQQFGPHFWPAFSSVYGIRVDYLSPILYLSDVSFVFLFFASFKKVFTTPLTKTFLTSLLFLLFLFTLVIPVSYAASYLALLYGLLKLFEFLFFGLYVATQLTKKDFLVTIEIFSLLSVFESILAVFQFLKQGSIGGILYFIGERSYTLSSLGVAVMNTPQGLMVRPYATFPHPNVLAFFLFTSVVLSSYGLHHARKKINYPAAELRSIPSEKYVLGHSSSKQASRYSDRKIKRALLLLAVIISEVGLFLTFSRTVIFVNLLFLVYAFGYVSLRESRVKVKKALFAIFLFAIIASFLFFYSPRFFSLSALTHDFLPRQDLIHVSFSAIRTFPLFGTGLNNFYYYEATVQKNFSSAYLQPVHNIFLFISSEIGIVGIILFLYFLVVVFQKAGRNLRAKKQLFSYAEVPFILLSAILFVGLFDHFFLTIQQGQLLFAFILGLSFSKAVG